MDKEKLEEQVKILKEYRIIEASHFSWGNSWGYVITNAKNTELYKYELRFGRGDANRESYVKLIKILSQREIDDLNNYLIEKENVLNADYPCNFVMDNSSHVFFKYKHITVKVDNENGLTRRLETQLAELEKTAKVENEEGTLLGRIKLRQ